MDLYEQVQIVLEQPNSVNARAALAHTLEKSGHPETYLVWMTASHLAATLGEFFSALTLARFHLKGTSLRHQIEHLALAFSNQPNGCDLPAPLPTPPPIALPLPKDPDTLIPLALQIGSSAPNLKRTPGQKLANPPIFSELAYDEFISLASGAEPISILPGEELISQNEREQALYLLSHGEICIRQKRTTEGWVDLANINAPTLIGEMSLLTSLPHRASAFAQTPCLAWRIHTPLLTSLSQNHPQLIPQIHELIEQRQLNNLFRTSELLRAIDDKDKFLQAFSFQHAREGELIIEQGTQAPGLFLILYGLANVSTQTDDGRLLHITTLAEGDTFGEMSLLTGEPTLASIAMQDGGTLLHLPPQHYHALREEIPELEQKLRDLVSLRQRELDDIIGPISHSNIETLDASWFRLHTKPKT